ncbi:hypothetical protein D3C84_592900 [compost metagenome]
MARCSFRFCGGSDDAGTGVRPALSQLPERGVYRAGTRLPMPPGERAASGDCAADLHYWSQHCTAVVS